MKQLYLLIVGVLITYLPLNAQISEGGEPLSKKIGLSFEGIEHAQLAPFNLEQVRAEDAEDEKAGTYPKIGRVRPLDINLHTADSWTDVKDGKLWRMALKSRDAQGLSVQFEDFNLPAGGKLFIYSPNYKHVIGAFTDFNNHESGIFSTALIPGDEVIVEYFEPSSTEGLGQFKIAGLVHAYRMVPGTESAQRDFGDSDPCQVNVNCSEGNNWQNQKRGVVRIFIIEGQFAGWCSGSLVNNTAEDCTPYVLTALHCGLNATTANMNQWIFYFNYESSGCANGTSGQVPNNTMQGCARIADSGDGGGDNGSDYMLVEINNNVPQSYNPYFNGWRSNNVSSASGVSIHHPSGDIKKLSTYSNNLQSVTWGGPAGTHWLVTWSSTANGHGVTEPGSSGSPIFDNQGRIIGTLTGGSSFCTSPTSPDSYGKMSYHWNSNPGDNLSQFLDPTNSGATTLNGTNQPCDGAEPGGDCVVIPPYPTDDPCVITVIAEDSFCCEEEWDNICEEAYIDCTGGGCEAGEVSVALSQNVCPGELGIFDATGVSIPSGGGYAVQFLPNGGTGGNGTGFSITGVQPLPFEFDNDINGILSANSFPPLSGTWVLTGFAYTDPDNAGNSICSITEVDVTVNFLAAGNPACTGGGGDNNDDCANAILVVPGVHPFSTIGATTDGPDQPGSACDAFQQSNVHNDVWFEYTASCDGVSSFSTCNSANFDTRIAVYPGGQCPPTAASLIICNDDSDGCDDYTSYLEWDVVEGATYLLRIGGYGPTDEGTGNFVLIENCEGGPVEPTNDESFEGDFPPACWSIIDADGDGQNWFKYGSNVPGNPLFGVAQDGFYTAASASWFGSPLTPNNFLVTPQLALGSNEELVYWVAGQDPDWSAENYAVFLSTSGNAAADFTVNLFEETLVDDTWLQRTIDLSAYAGQDVYLAFRHYNVTDQFYIKIDNVTLPGNIIPCAVEPPGDECLDWVSPSPTGGWTDFNTEFGGAPANDGTGCPIYTFITFEVWMSEAYAMDNVVEGTSYTFSHCEGPGAGTWVPEYTIIAPSGAIDAFGAGDGDGCSITWIASESGTYLIVINEAGNCGVGAQVDNGYPAITCNDAVTNVEEVITQDSFLLFPNPNNGQFSIQMKGAGGVAHVDILEVSGKVVQSVQINFTDNSINNVDLGSRASGMYFVRITMNENIFVERVVVQ